MDIGAFIKDPDLIGSIKDARLRLIMVMGGSDTGKTTLVESLAAELAAHAATGVVDLDMGQSRIGPPSTLAWGRFVAGGSLDGITPEDFYFTGAFSPPGNLLPALIGAKKMADKAARSCAKLVIDTTGLVQGPVGLMLKQYKIELLCPDIVIALEREGELEDILKGFSFQKSPLVFRLPAPNEAISKTPAKRADYREAKLRRYFSGSRVIRVETNKAGLRFTGGYGKPLKGRLVSLRDEAHEDLALGVIEDVDEKGNNISVRTPMEEGKRFAALVIGTVAIAGC